MPVHSPDTPNLFHAFFSTSSRLLEAASAQSKCRLLFNLHFSSPAGGGTITNLILGTLKTSRTNCWVCNICNATKISTHAEIAYHNCLQCPHLNSCAVIQSKTQMPTETHCAEATCSQSSQLRAFRMHIYSKDTKNNFCKHVLPLNSCQRPDAHTGCGNSRKTPGRPLALHFTVLQIMRCETSDIKTLLKVAASTSVLASIHSFNKKQDCAINNF